MARLDRKYLEGQLAKGFIAGIVDKGPVKPPRVTTSEGEQITLKEDKGAKNKGWIELNLVHWCAGKGMELRRELAFDRQHGGRKWRFDWAILKGRTAGQGSAGNYHRGNVVAAVEYEGLFSETSGHRTMKGVSNDIAKYNQAQALGWKVLRVSAKNYKSLITELEKLL